MLPYVPNSVQISSGNSIPKRALYWRGGQRTGQDFTQSLWVEAMHSDTQNLDHTHQKSFTESVQVSPWGTSRHTPHSAARYRQNQDKREIDSQQDLSHGVQLASSKFQHNIRNPEIRKKQLERSQTSKTQSTQLYLSRSTYLQEQKAFHESYAVSPCSCKRFHRHKFFDPPRNRVIVNQALKRKNLLTSYDESCIPSDTYDDPRNIFWLPALSFHPFKQGDSLVEFSSLWPKEAELKNLLRNSGLQLTLIRGAVLDLCKLSVTCGPVRLLKCLIDLSLVRIDQQFEDGSGMLHLACLSRNFEATQFLVDAKISPNIQDRNGCTADQVCFCPQLKKQLPKNYLVHKEKKTREQQSLMRPSLQDKDTIFSLARNPKFYTELQKKLQKFDFNVNTECDSNGDFLLHIAAKGGLSHLPSVMSLLKIQKADVELCNADGMTVLMLAASTGNCVLCDVLICLFGADTNKQNPNNGYSALHYAVEGNHRKTVECLIRRGADVNMEAEDGRRPDDFPSCSSVQDDCKEVISFNRVKRLEDLSERVRKGDIEGTMLLPSDMCVVDDDGYSLLMIAAVYNQVVALEKLLLINKSTINAQHIKSGMPALSIAAQMGNVAIVETLLEQGANPEIADMEGHLPLHHAVLNNYETVLDIFLKYFPDAYVGLYKAQRLCKKSSIYIKLKKAWERRQEEIVIPKVFDCAMNGKASELYCMLEDGDSINVRSGSGNWPLYLAVENGHLEVVKLLFEKGGDIRKRHSTTGSTVLHLASKMGHLAIVEFLIQFCRPSGDITKMKQKAQNCKRILDINVVDAEYRTALQLAAEKGFIKIANLLLQYGASTSILDSQGFLFTCPEYEGVRIRIEAERDQHTKLVVKCITEKSKKAFTILQEVWLPRFDHNLRTKEGDTPLMLACYHGRLPVVKFLLESAVYSDLLEEEDETYSDGDSGVLDPSGSMIRNKYRSSLEDEFQTSFSQSVEVDELTHSTEVRTMDATATSSPNKLDGTLQSLLKDVRRPKGLSIYQSGYISHISAVNLFNGNTPLHRSIEGADNPSIVNNLLKLDNFCLNIQNDAGLSPLHLACHLRRKKVIDLLLSQKEVDLNCRTLEGHLPEDMTNVKSIIQKIKKAREASSKLLPIPDNKQDNLSLPSESVSETTINFDRVHSRYEALKKQVKAGNKN